MPRLIVWGAGGHGKVVIETASAVGRYDSILVVDDDAAKRGGRVLGYVVAGPIADIPRHPDDEVFLALGDNRTRATAYDWCKAAGFTLATLLHPRAVISPSAAVQEGTLVMPLSVVNAEARIGRNCIINTGAVVEHDCLVGDHVHLSPGVKIGGNATIDAFAHVGIGAVVLPGISVGAGTTVGAGAVVVTNLPANIVAAGVPARIRA